MDFPVDEIISNDKNKYEMSVAMIRYARKIEEIPELLLEYDEKERDKRLKIIMKDVLSGTVKYHTNVKE